MPDPRDFRSPESWYAVLYHELGHSCAHRTRLDRMKGDTAWAKFGSPGYALEELTAELTSGYLCAECQIFDVLEENAVAYCQSWIRVLKNDKTLFVRAAGKAQHSADYIVNRAEQQAQLAVAA